MWLQPPIEDTSRIYTCCSIQALHFAHWNKYTTSYFMVIIFSIKTLISLWFTVAESKTNQIRFKMMTLSKSKCHHPDLIKKWLPSSNQAGYLEMGMAPLAIYYWLVTFCTNTINSNSNRYVEFLTKSLLTRVRL